MKSSSRMLEVAPSDFSTSTLCGDDLQVTWVRTSVLLQYCNPFNGCWLDIDVPVRQEEVAACLAASHEQLHPPKDWAPWVRQTKRLMLANRKEHIEKIAWFVHHGFQQPIQIDVGVPSLRCHVDHMIVDGNHRFASAVFRLETMGQDTLIPLAVYGSESYARELGLAPDAPQDSSYGGAFN